MATTKIYLDTRRQRTDGTYPLKIMINHNNETALVNLNVYLRREEWIGCQVVGHPERAFFNNYITKRKNEIDRAILTLADGGNLGGITARELRRRVENTLAPAKAHDGAAKPLFYRHFVEFMESHDAPRTRECYRTTLRHLQRFDADIERLTFEDITKAWLVAFDRHLAATSPARNARNIHLRNIRAVFNDAIDNELTTCYPFRRFSIIPEPTVHRALTVEELRTLFNYPCEAWQQLYVDIFKLIFFLVGINIIDLCNLKEITQGRVEYLRAKTHRLYSIKVEPEAQAIIDKYRGTSALLNIADRYHNYADFARRLNRTIQHLGQYERRGRGGKKYFTPLFPHLTTYYMRHTWATIAAELDVPFDTISLALGHTQASGARVTQVYIKFNNKKIDEANRRVLDFVLYDKK